MTDIDETIEDRYVASENVILEDNHVASKGEARDNRRRTMWKPDDTSVLTIHPGAYDKTLQDDTIGMPLSTTASIANMSRQSAGPVRQSISAAPKRAPLRSFTPVQPVGVMYETVKCMDGKENIPPGPAIFLDKSKPDKHEKSAKALEPIKPLCQPITKSSTSSRPSILGQQKAPLQARVSSTKKRSAPEPKIDQRKTKETRISLKDRAAKPTRSLLEQKVPTKLSLPSVQPRVNGSLARYPVLDDDLVQPELYEDNWLNHQEVALTQLINALLQQADSKALLSHHDVSTIRSKLLKSYQHCSMVTLHKRIKASLVYGALSMPKDTKDLPRLREDVGLRRQFLDLWVQSYDLDALQAAAEVIIGRAMTARPRDAASVAQSLGSSSGNAASVKEREIRRFLLTFLVHHEDAADVSAQVQKNTPASETSVRVGSPEWFWQRTVLHSLMLILLLDTAKTSDAVFGCLFQPTSIRKSSESILFAFTRMLLPWIGDITRPLKHLDYSLSHAQLPLSEYNYVVKNLATDLRDGVLLTRIVELLLHPVSSSQKDSGQTLTLSLPDGETLTSVIGSDSEQSWVLSQHLKFPCAGRAQKLHNVQIAMSALEGVQGGLTEAAISNTRADDIVDGHREKTLSLLWSLISRWGLGLLVDWEELQRETKRFAADDLAFDSRRYLDEELFSLETEMALQPDAHEQVTLLKSWASSIGNLKDIPVTNLTTSFADGCALSCIVAAYSEFLPQSAVAKGARHSDRAIVDSTADALRALGCSDSFTALFANTQTIPRRSTTTALLAFLASRLLPLARSHRAAKTIQKAYRLCLARRMVAKRIVCMRLANECAVIVEMKREFDGAAKVLQRAWRARNERINQRIFNEAVLFQKMARGWAIRKAFKGVLGEQTGVVGRRVMGGW
ncbi:hypothetical protein BDV97DRAFT_293191 [Delphinella strobiligena]|nr:hypothetical protein BDV97DRAFT_293191 [Delphinella strobiligena]